MSLLNQVLESLLFVSSRPMSVKDLVKLTEAPEPEVEQALLELQAARAGSGIVLLHTGTVWQLATHPSSVDAVRKLLQSDLKEKLSDASLEVLATVAYKQPVSRAEVEAIRGVNSQYSLRLLLMRGLVEKTGDSRGTRYQVTTEFLQQLGLQSVTALPHYEETMAKVRLPKNAERPANKAEYTDSVSETTDDKSI